MAVCPIGNGIIKTSQKLAFLVLFTAIMLDKASFYPKTMPNLPFDKIVF
jgi:hypothetical protein